MFTTLIDIMKPRLRFSNINLVQLFFYSANTKHLHNICTTSAQHLWRWSDIEQILYNCSVFTRVAVNRLNNVNHVMFLYCLTCLSSKQVVMSNQLNNGPCGRHWVSINMIAAEPYRNSRFRDWPPEERARTDPFEMCSDCWAVCFKTLSMNRHLSPTIRVRRAFTQASNVMI